MPNFSKTKLGKQALAASALSLIFLTGTAYADGIETFGQDFFEEVQQRLNTQLSGVVHGQILALQSTDYNWYWQLNNGFNAANWSFDDRIAQPGQLGATELAQGSSFTTTYGNTVLPAISFQFSKADQNTINQSQTNASADATTLVNQWQTAIGKITSKQLSDAADALGQDPGTFTNLDYIIDYQMAYIWSCAKAQKTPPIPLAGINPNNLANSLKCMPASGRQILGFITPWLNASASSLNLLDQQNQAQAILATIKTNVRQPTEDNGGTTTSDGIVRPTYAISKSVSAINQELSDTGNEVALSVDCTNISQKTVTTSVSGSAGIDIPVLDFLSFGISGSSQFDLSSFKGVDQNMTVTMTYTGVTYFDVVPDAFATSSGWYSSTIIAEAVDNTGKDVTGYVFTSQPGGIDFSAGGNFGRVQTLLISQYPKIAITVEVTNIQEFEQSFQQKLKTSVSFLGIPLGHAEGNFYESSYDYDKTAGTVTINFDPGNVTTIGSDDQKVAYVMGAVIQYPGSN